MHPGKYLFTLILSIAYFFPGAQTITGVWKGKINRQKVEVKIVQKGDSLTGTSYYYEPGGYRRYSIKGFFDPYSNAVTWWDDQLLESKGNAGGKNPMLSIADFNCPGGGKMLLEGSTATQKDPDVPKGPVDLSKQGSTSFPDEWDFVIDNYTSGTNHPDIIDSISNIKKSSPGKEPILVKNNPPRLPAPKKGMVTIPPMPGPEKQTVASAMPLTIEEKFIHRKNLLTKEIPISGDSIELRFYDNAEIDGDSISLFLNNKLVFKNIRLSNLPYTIKFALADLDNETELVMVAENLGTIPPNTAYMLAIVNEKRYDVYLASTEETSAMIRFRKE
jgi:hypothetical protein